MASNKPEINLEICNGTFRVPTDEAILNITVVGDGNGTVTRVVEKIVDVERGMAFPEEGSGENDEYYKKISTDIYNDIGNLAKSLTSTMTDIPAEDRKEKRAELDEAGEKIDAAKAKLKEIVNMTESATMEILDQVEKVQDQTGGVRDLLQSLRDHSAFSSVEDGGGDGIEEAENPVKNEMVGIRGEIEKALGILNSQQSSAVEEPLDEPSTEESAQPPAAGKSRYMFDLDVIFQTMYELCTNETVKDHITDARQKAGEIIDTNGFIDLISDNVRDMEPDSDNFLQVSLSDILGPLSESCADKSIQNLMKNMDKNQESIFLDQSLPLEMPSVEEGIAEIVEDTPAEVEESGQEAAPVADNGELTEILEGILPRLDELVEKSEKNLFVSNSSDTVMTIGDQQEIFSQIENAFNLVSGITVDSSKITEVLSFQDLSGQQIMKIIKLLTDFQVQLLGIVVSFGSQLKRKEKEPAISIEESKALAQEDVDNYMEKIAAKVESENDDDTTLDQDAVNEILEEMGF